MFKKSEHHEILNAVDGPLCSAEAVAFRYEVEIRRPSHSPGAALPVAGGQHAQQVLALE